MQKPDVRKGQGSVKLSREEFERRFRERFFDPSFDTVEPEIVLMDEPCSALDPIATAKVEELIRQLKTQYTIVIVTHNMQQAGRCSDRTAFFYLGNLIEVDDTTKIFSNPARRQTEEYITGRFG